jgi:hypothetical protein
MQKLFISMLYSQLNTINYEMNFIKIYHSMSINWSITTVV